ncbi:MAG: chaperonin GroEL [Acidimicrobiales bacterium]|nr:chaperonin GroEL [Acidimicrobiales bacterium]
MAGHTQLLFRDDARAKLLAGATALADAVRPTLGPESRSVLLAKKFGNPTICDDGVTIAKQITLQDPEEQLGAQMLRQSAIQTGDTVGDGTTTSTLLAYAIFREGLRNIVAGASPIGLKRGLEKATKAAVEALAEVSRPVASFEDMAHIAAVSAHDNHEIGELVAKAVTEVGADGVIDVEEASGTETELDLVEGMRFDKGYLSPYFVTDPEAMEAVFEDPVILIHDKKITTMQPLLPLLELVVQNARPLIIVAETVEGEALATLVVNKLRGILPVCAIKAPGFGDRRKAMLGDLAVLTGGRIISEELGDKLENVVLDDLGSAHRVVVDADSATFIDGAGTPEAIDGRRAELKRLIENTTSDWDREKLEERLARLSGGVAVIRVGATSEAELSRDKEAYDDAINSTRAAVAEGVVPGGGAALLRTHDTIDALVQSSEGDERTGARIIRDALAVPCRQLAENAGADPGVVAEKVQAGTGFFGFDARNRTYTDLAESGIIDATKVVRSALENAVAVAGVLLLTEVTMIEVEDAEPAAPMAPPMM